MSSNFISTLLKDARIDDQGRPLSTSVQDASLKQLVKDLRLTKADMAQPVDGNNLLSLLDPTRNTIAYLFVLLALWKQAQKTRQVDHTVLDPAVVFCASFDPVQARYVGQELRELSDRLAEHYRQTKDASVVPAIGAAILGLDPAGSTFTSTHLLFLQLCLEARLPSLALPVLDKDIYNYPSTPIESVDDQELCAIHETSATFITRTSGLTKDITALDVQEYYLLGAHVYIGLQQWSRARLFLELVLATPAIHIATPLMLEAYKRLILVGLLSTGQPFSAKALVDQQTHKTLSSLSKAYETLGEVFKNRDLQRLNAEIDCATQLWADDNNLGLINHVAESLHRYRVIDLQKTYSAIPVSRIATHLTLSPTSTLTLLTSMISTSQIKAILLPSETDSSTQTILRFLTHDPSQTHTSDAHQAAVLQAKYTQIEQLSLHVREADRKLAISNSYVEFVRRSKRAEGAGAPGYEDPMEESYDGGPSGSGRPGLLLGDGDENMMEDV